MTEKKRVLITGASRGIGRATALKLSQQGYETVIHYHQSRDLADQVLDEIRQNKGIAHSIQFDIRDRENCKAALEADMDQHGAYYGVVCNAGIAKDNAFPALTGEEWDGVIETNLTGLYNVLYPVIMPMIRLRQGGRVVTLSSVSGQAGNRGQVNYSAAKSGIIGATKALAIELGKRKITVNCVAPGIIDTDMTTDFPQEHLKQLVPLATIGQPEDVAAAIAFLMSNDAKYITRQVIGVNGGMY